jgi:hypothetical protein
MVYGWGKNGLLRAGWEKQKRGKENKTKQKKKLAGCSWLGGEKEEREREREREREKGLLLRTWLGGKKKKEGLLRTSWLGGRKKRERERKKKKKGVHVAGWEKEKGGKEKKIKNKNPVVTFQKVKRYQWSPKLKILM